jgi:acyl dehydratase
MAVSTAVTGLSIPSDLVGQQAGPLSHPIDARWLMAYAAGLGETDPRYYDTLDAAGPAAHPVFSVCYEWPLAVALRAATISEDIARQGVHAIHDLTIHRPPRAGDTLVTTARIAGVARRPAGALVMVRFDTADTDGRPVTTTAYGSVYRRVAVTGADREPTPPLPSTPTATASTPDAEAAAARRPDTGAASVRVEVPVHLAHVYSECARIWNPIHTDAAVARQAGLPAIILHGSATLALAVSRLLAHLGLEPRHVSRVTCRFSGMVRLPSAFTVRLSPGMPAPAERTAGLVAPEERAAGPVSSGTGEHAAGLVISRTGERGTSSATAALGNRESGSEPGSSAGRRVVYFDAVGEDGRPILSRGALAL